MARGGVLVSRNGYRGTLPCRALWDMSSTEVAAQMTYYSSAGTTRAYRRRRSSCVLQTFNFGSSSPLLLPRFSESPAEGRGVFALAPPEKDASPEDCSTLWLSTLKFSLTAQRKYWSTSHIRKSTAAVRDQTAAP
ncbi:hypothetical protein ROHU_005931 [Labeo rohita]|uniref:Uncharacterized protein n=1 Tax=Labeo rohita TaxID=84645 RepID=A0A498MUD5_LABRO|nr:hypothetical protein ROHU_005931 [Labeo rohita]